MDQALPKVGEILRRLRLQKDLSLKEVADAVELSVSFLSAVERGTSDISLGRLGRLAEFFGHDLGSLLGYESRLSRPQILYEREKISIDRGEGVRFDVYRLPALGVEFILNDIAPHSGFREELAHEGLDAILVIDGPLTLTVNGNDYILNSGDCAVYSAAYPHRSRNDSDRPIRVVCMSSERAF